MRKPTIHSLVAGSLALTGVTLGAGSVEAYEAGDTILRAGVISVQPDESSSALKLNGAPLSGTTVGVDGSEQLGLTATLYVDREYWCRPLGRNSF